MKNFHTERKHFDDRKRLPRVKGLRDRCKGCWWHVELNIEKFDRRSIIVPSVHSVVKFDRTADGD